MVYASKIGLVPVAKFDNGDEGVRYAFNLNGHGSPFVESGAFRTRTKKGSEIGIAAYTTSVSRGCVLASSGLDAACGFCRTGKSIGYQEPMTAEQIALENVFMALDDEEAIRLGKQREFAYMGQGEPGLAYQAVKAAILATNGAMGEMNATVYRHIFATSGVPDAIKRLGMDISDGGYGGSEILLHMSVHGVGKTRDSIMPIGLRFPLADVISASMEYHRLTGNQSVVNYMLFKDANLVGAQGVSTISPDMMRELTQMLDPAAHRVILCEYNPFPGVTNGEVTRDEVDALVQVLDAGGFTHKEFIAFGRKDGLACGLLGGQAEPNLPYESIEGKLEQAEHLVLANIPK